VPIQHGGEQRSILAIPDRKHVGLTTFDATNPDSACRQTVPLRPSKRGAQRARDSVRRRGASVLRARVRGHCHISAAERLAEQGLMHTGFHSRL
jgi:hypothetical protein